MLRIIKLISLTLGLIFLLGGFALSVFALQVPTGGWVLGLYFIIPGFIAIAGSYLLDKKRESSSKTSILPLAMSLIGILAIIFVLYLAYSFFKQAE